MYDRQTSLRANMSMRMVLRSSDDATLFDNKPYDFNVQLDKQRRIEGNWVVALTEINVNYTGTAKQVKDIYGRVHRKYRRKVRKTSAAESPHRYQ